MSPSTLTTFNALNAVNLRAETTVAPTGSTSDSFQALLDIGTDENTSNKNPRSARNDDDDRKEIIAAPVEVATLTPPEPAKLQADDDDQDAHVRAYNKNAERTRIADNDESEKSATRLGAKDSDTQPAAPAQTKETVTAKSTDAAKAAADTSDASSAQAALADDLHSHINALSQALQMLATLSGNPQTVSNTQVKIDTLVVQAASFKLAGNAEPTAGFDTSAGTETEGDYSPKLALGDILSQIARIRAILDKAKDESVPNVIPAIRALINDLRALSHYLHEHPEASKEWGDEKTNAILATRALIREYKSLMAANDDVPSPIAVKPTIITKTNSSPDPVLRTAAAAPITPSIDTTPIQPNLTPAAAIAAAATAQTGADTQTNTGGNQNSNNPLPMQISSMREANQTQAASAANAPDFARLLQQAKMPVMEQVMVHIKTGLHDGSSKIEIKLEPEALGKVELKMNTDVNGKTVVSVTADHKGTLDLLQRDARGLERALADAGLKTDSGSLSFNLRGGQQEANPDTLLAQSYRNPLAEEAEIAAVSTSSRSYVVNVTHGLDITI